MAFYNKSTGRYQVFSDAERRKYGQGQRETLHMVENQLRSGTTYVKLEDEKEPYMKSFFPLNAKRLVIFACAWGVLVITWVILNDPYGSSMRGSEWTDFWQVLFTPPLAVSILNYLFIQFINSNE